ncbi:hypothetical protein HDU96_003824 [Phlyctochytrium bullatum]|nr:hypothetical protein HDU96_003824 [Phlyctochytrium bullatum]
MNGSSGYSSDDSTSSAATTRNSSKKILKNFAMNNTSIQGTPVLVLEPLNETFVTKRLDLLEVVKIGRKVNAKVGPEPSNGIFDSKVLSRNHAEIWFEEGQVLIKDVKSSNGTFVNGFRLSEEGQASSPHPLQTGDMIEFGIDIMNDDGVSEKTMALETRSELESIKATLDFIEGNLGRGFSLTSNGDTEAKLNAELQAAKAAASAAESTAETLRMQFKDASDESRMWREKWEALREEMGRRRSDAEKSIEVKRVETENLTKALNEEIQSWKEKTEQALAEVESWKKVRLSFLQKALAYQQ